MSRREERERALRAALDELANKAGWCLDHGATNENRDLAESVIDFRWRVAQTDRATLLRETESPAPSEQPDREWLARWLFKFWCGARGVDPMANLAPNSSFHEDADRLIAALLPTPSVAAEVEAADRIIQHVAYEIGTVLGIAAQRNTGEVTEAQRVMLESWIRQLNQARRALTAPDQRAGEEGK